MFTDCEGPIRRTNGSYPNCNLDMRFDDPGMIAWTWQYCTQWGFMQSTNFNAKQLGSKFNTLQHQHDVCHRQFPDGSASGLFPDWPDTAKTNAVLGGWNIRPSNVFWSGGEFDPWRTLSPLSSRPDAPPTTLTSTPPQCGVKTPTSTIFAHVLSNAEHCFDFRTTNAIPSVLAEGAETRKTFSNALRGWLQCWTPKNGKAAPPMSTYDPDQQLGGLDSSFSWDDSGSSGPIGPGAVSSSDDSGTLWIWPPQGTKGGKSSGSTSTVSVSAGQSGQSVAVGGGQISTSISQDANGFGGTSSSGQQAGFLESSTTSFQSSGVGNGAVTSGSSQSSGASGQSSGSTSQSSGSTSQSSGTTDGQVTTSISQNAGGFGGTTSTGQQQGSIESSTTSFQGSGVNAGSAASGASSGSAAGGASQSSGSTGGQVTTSISQDPAGFGATSSTGQQQGSIESSTTSLQGSGIGAAAGSSSSSTSSSSSVSKDGSTKKTYEGARKRKHRKSGGAKKEGSSSSQKVAREVQGESAVTGRWRGRGRGLWWVGDE